MASKPAELTTKQTIWDGMKILARMDVLKDRRVAGPVGARKKTPCTCGHTAKHHKKTGRCRGKVPTDRNTFGAKIAEAYGVPGHLVGVKKSCDCQAGVR